MRQRIRQRLALLEQVGRHAQLGQARLDAQRIAPAAERVRILTERDVVRAIADGVDPAVTGVSEYMTPHATTVLNAGPQSYWRLNEASGAGTAASAVLANEGSDNATYHDMVEAIFQRNGGSRGDAASTFARVVGGEASPHDESRFHMSYAGWDRVYRDDTTEAPPPLRDVAGELPLRSTREKDRGECFLGQECP